MSQLRIFRKQAHCGVLGPGNRAVIWVQGCSFACPGCLVPESWNSKGGELAGVDSLAEWLLGLKGIEGVTFSGGEPFGQAEALLELTSQLKLRGSNLGLMSYTGYSFEWLLQHGTEAQRALLDRLDLLIDGRYRREMHADILWRGSLNQKIHLLSERYLGRLPKDDVGSGLELRFSPDGTFTFNGVPPWGDFAYSIKGSLLGR